MRLFPHLSKVSVVAAALASALLASCGGGDQEETFRPNRIIALGDENSLIVPTTGREYTMNNVQVSTGNPNGVACQNSPIWVWYVAADYGLPFSECGGGTESPNALMRATLGGTVASVQAALDTVNASGSPVNGKDLVTLMVGTHDVLEIIGTNKNPSSAELASMTTLAEARGEQAGGIIQQVIGRGGKILFTSIPDLGTAPISLSAYTNGGYSSAALTALSSAFNKGLNTGSTVANGGGRNGAVVQVYSLVSVYRNNADTYTSFTNRVAASCVTTDGTAIIEDADLVNCTWANAATDVTPLFYLWSGRVQFGWYTHYLLGQEAIARIHANPL